MTAACDPYASFPPAIAKRLRTLDMACNFAFAHAASPQSGRAILPINKDLVDYCSRSAQALVRELFSYLLERTAANFEADEQMRGDPAAARDLLTEHVLLIATASHISRAETLTKLNEAQKYFRPILRSDGAGNVLTWSGTEKSAFALRKAFEDLQRDAQLLLDPSIHRKHEKQSGEAGAGSPVTEVSRSAGASDESGFSSRNPMLRVILPLSAVAAVVAACGASGHGIDLLTNIAAAIVYDLMQTTIQHTRGSNHPGLGLGLGLDGLSLP